MKRLTAAEIKHILYGILLSDGHIDSNNDRFELYTKHREYADYVADVLSQITGMEIHNKPKHDKRGYTGYRVWTRNHPYWFKMRDRVYRTRKQLTAYNVSRLTCESIAHIWMCDGYLEHAKNRKTNSVQNIGWLCLEAFPPNELALLQNHLVANFNIHCSMIPKPRWGYGVRLRVGGENLQRLISLVYPFVLSCFEKKTVLFYKNKESADMSLPSAEHFIKEYNEVDDIVRYSKELEKRNG
jgi:hypothetical protein